MKYITLIPWGTIILACDGNIGSGAVRADGPKIEPSAEKTIPLVGRGSCLAIATLPRSRRRSSLRRVRFGIEHLDWPPGDGSKRLAPIQIVYAFFPSDGLLPDSFFDCSKRYELQAVRDTRCDESVESLSYLKSVDVDSGIAAILRITIPGWSAQRRPRAGCGPRLLHSETRKVQSPNREGGDGSI